MTTEQQTAATPQSNGASKDLDGLTLPRRDVRRKRPPALFFLLRLETLRRVGRVTSLLVLDFIGVIGALFTALMLKLVVRDHVSFSVVWHQTKQWTPFAYLITVLMFAHADLYAERARRPGFARIATAPSSDC